MGVNNMEKKNKRNECPYCNLDISIDKNKTEVKLTKTCKGFPVSFKGEARCNPEDRFSASDGLSRAAIRAEVAMEIAGDPRYKLDDLVIIKSRYGEKLEDSEGFVGMLSGVRFEDNKWRYRVKGLYMPISCGKPREIIRQAYEENLVKLDADLFRRTGRLVECHEQ